MYHMKICKVIYRLCAFILFSVLLVPHLNGQELTAPTSSWAVKSNLLYDATTSLNLGAEFKVGQRLTVDIPLSYNPFSFGDNKKWKHILLQPELRWWVKEPFTGHFFGLHAHYAYYNVGGIGTRWMKDNRFEGWLVGAGLAYGYQLFLGRHWNLELSIGSGYAYLDYKRYSCKTCGDFKGNENKHYIGPTKAAVTLVYVIK